MPPVIASEPAIFLIYLFYGAVFFAIGVAITSRHKTISSLKIAGLFGFFSLFAFFHAFHEWLELFLKMSLLPDGRLLFFVSGFNLFLVLSSFLFLLIFGVNLCTAIYPRTRTTLSLFSLLLAGSFLWLFFVRQPIDNRVLMKFIDLDIRRWIGFPATVMTGFAFLAYSRQLKVLTRRGAGNFFGAGLTLFVYGILTGLVPSTTPLMAGVPVEVFRALTALAMLHFIMYGLDIFLTEKEEMVANRLEDAARSQRLTSMGRLAAGIAHEINNPLASVSLQLEMLFRELEQVSLPEKTKQRLHTIEKNVGKSAMIARELLLFASDRSADLHFEACGIGKIIDSAWQLIAPKRRHIRLHVDNAAREITVRGIVLKLEELFVNLFLNGIDAMPDGGIIEVKGRFDKNGAVVFVHDQGSGISPEMASLIMEPFFTTKEVGAGTGLGLSICHGIMEQHEGSISIESRPGGGTTVMLSFPGR